MGNYFQSVLYLVKLKEACKEETKENLSLMPKKSPCGRLGLGKERLLVQKFALEKNLPAQRFGSNLWSVQRPE